MSDRLFHPTVWSYLRGLLVRGFEGPITIWAHRGKFVDFSPVEPVQCPRTADSAPSALPAVAAAPNPQQGEPPPEAIQKAASVSD
jgi:hypothetical protein